jgi:hypothetical protein
MSAIIKLPMAPEPTEPGASRPIEVCAKLRTKMAFGSFYGAEDWRLGESSTAVYWCLRTMETWGTDDQLAHPHACIRGRSCFAAPVGSEEIG